jgi:cytochrome c-type biogenesis protein CcmH/NrfF
MRRAVLLCALVALLAALVAAPALALALAAKASLPDIEDEVMCTSCNVTLNVAESAQADRQRALIRRLIDQGLDKRQIKAALVAEYGEDVLALPKGDGFGLTAYAVPIGLVVVLAAAMALLLPSWRRRSPAGIGSDEASETLSDDDTRRLDDDLGRYA